MFDLAIGTQFHLEYPFTVDHFVASRLGNHVENILTDKLFYLFNTSCSPLSSIRMRHGFCIYEWVWINVCNLCWLVAHCSGNFDNSLCPPFDSTRHGGLRLSRGLLMFIERLLITIIIITYGLVFEPSRSIDLRWQVQDSYRDRSIESRGSRSFNSKFSWGILWGSVG